MKTPCSIEVTEVSPETRIEVGTFEFEDATDLLVWIHENNVPVPQEEVSKIYAYISAIVILAEK